jgi:biotin carboxyl carrier protein
MSAQGMSESRPVTLLVGRTPSSARDPLVAHRRVQGLDCLPRFFGRVSDLADSEGQPVEAGPRLVVLEAMKMDIRVAAPPAGTVERLAGAPGLPGTAGKSSFTPRPELEL